MVAPSPQQVNSKVLIVGYDGVTDKMYPVSVDDQGRLVLVGGGGGGGTVELGATSLAALENITVDAVISAVDLSPATLAALENIIVSGSVSLDAGTLAALENITATISGPIALDGTTLAALENITVLQGTDPWVVTGPLTDAQLRASRVPVDVEIDQPLTDTQLRAASVPVTPTNSPLEAQQDGAWGYAGGSSGTVTLTGSKRVLAITAVCGGTPGTITINGGDSIPVPTNVGLQIGPKGNLVDPTIVFSSTDSYFVEFTT
jgi:hypothetical protein